MPGRHRRPNLMADRGWFNGAVALVLEGFRSRTLLKPMPQRHWTSPDRPQRPEDCMEEGLGGWGAGRWGARELQDAVVDRGWPNGGVAGALGRSWGGCLSRDLETVVGTSGDVWSCLVDVAFRALWSIGR